MRTIRSEMPSRAAAPRASTATATTGRKRHSQGSLSGVAPSRRLRTLNRLARIRDGRGRGPPSVGHRYNSGETPRSHQTGGRYRRPPSPLTIRASPTDTTCPHALSWSLFGSSARSSIRILGAGRRARQRLVRTNRDDGLPTLESCSDESETGSIWIKIDREPKAAEGAFPRAGERGLVAAERAEAIRLPNLGSRAPYRHLSRRTLDAVGLHRSTRTWLHSARNEEEPLDPR
jgi:hypothetical protein